MSAYNTLDQAIAGLPFGTERRVSSVIAMEAIAFGKPVMGFSDAPGKGYNMHVDKVTTLLDADLVTSNVITTTINGTAIATTYATSHAATMTAHIAAINASSALQALGIGAVAGGTNRGIVITTKGLDLTVTQVVTLGATQAGSTQTTTTWGTFLGVAMFTQLGDAGVGAGSATYEIGDAVNVLEYGEVWVPAASTAGDLEAAYIIIAAGTTQGQFTDSSSSTYDCKGKFRSTYSNGLARLEVRGVN